MIGSAIGRMLVIALVTSDAIDVKAVVSAFTTPLPSIEQSPFFRFIKNSHQADLNSFIRNSTAKPTDHTIPESSAPTGTPLANN